MTEAEQLELAAKALYAIRDQLSQEPGPVQIRTALLIAETTTTMLTTLRLLADDQALT